MKKLLATLLIALLLCSVGASALGETMTLSFIGDCTVGDMFSHRGYKSSFTYKVDEMGMDYPFSLSADVFAADDLTIANCEVSFTTRRPYYPAKTMSLSALPKYVEVLQLGNVDVCNVTNNHDTDFGRAGNQDTYDNLAAAGIGAFGRDWTYVTEVKGVKIGFVGQSFPIEENKLKKLGSQIKELREAGCQLIVASMHWGKEESYKLNGQQLSSGPALIDMGADLVFGHGPHVLQPVDVYNGHLILYSTSNFTFGANAAPNDPDTAIFQVTFDVNDNGEVALNHFSAIPYCMHQNKDFRPWPYTETTDKERVWSKLWRAQNLTSTLPESFLTTGEADFTALELSAPAK